MTLNKNNYHYTSAPITNYTENYLKEKLISRGYIIKTFDCEASIMQRMNRVNLFFIINATLEKNNQTIDLTAIDNYSTFEDIREDFRPEIIDIFSDYKKNAIIENKHFVLTDSNDEVPKNDLSKAEHHNFESKKKHHIKFWIGSKAAQLIELLTDEKKIATWSNNQYIKEQKKIEFFNSLIFDAIDIKDTKLNCKMCFRPLSLNSPMTIEFVEDAYGVIVLITFDKLSSTYIPILENFLYERLFFAMSCYFSFQVVRHAAKE